MTCWINSLCIFRSVVCMSLCMCENSLIYSDDSVVVVVVFVPLTLNFFLCYVSLFICSKQMLWRHRVFTRFFSVFILVSSTFLNRCVIHPCSILFVQWRKQLNFNEMIELIWYKCKSQEVMDSVGTLKSKMQSDVHHGLTTTWEWINNDRLFLLKCAFKRILFSEMDF